MLITPTKQPPAGDPQFEHPVHALLSCSVFYDTGTGLKAGRQFFCERIFAETVLTQIEKWCLKYQFSMVNIGCYNPRKARHADGTPILPSRWSNHAFGLAIDFKGIKDEKGKFVSVNNLQDNAPAKWHELINNVTVAIKGINHKPEILVEGGGAAWCHFGIWKHI